MNQRSRLRRKIWLLSTRIGLADALTLGAFRFSVQDPVLSNGDVCLNRGMKVIDELFAAPKWDAIPSAKKSPTASATAWAWRRRLSPRHFFASRRRARTTPRFLVGTIIFVATMWLLYLCSTALSRLAANAPQMRSPDHRPFRDFSSDRRDLFAFHARTPARRLGLDDFRLIWLLAIFGVVMKLRTRGPLEKTVARALSRDGLADSDRRCGPSCRRCRWTPCSGFSPEALPTPRE